MEPHNTDTPYTADDIERFNRFTQFPKDRVRENTAFAAASVSERAHAESVLRRFGKTDIPENVGQALERLRRARYIVFLVTIRSREIAPPWSVVGPANYNKHARPDRAHRMMGRAFDDLNLARARLERCLQRHGPPATIRSDDSTALAQLGEKIAAAEERQSRMRAANLIVRSRKHNRAQKIEHLVTQCGCAQAVAEKLLQPDFAGRIGFASFELTNNLANIRRMQDRVKALTVESARSSATIYFPGGRMEDNAEDCRVRIYHDEKPDADMRAKLKSSGFHWTPSLGCWQRLRNNAARYAASVVTGVGWTGPSTPTAEQPPALDSAPDISAHSEEPDGQRAGQGLNP